MSSRFIIPICYPSRPTPPPHMSSLPLILPQPFTTFHTPSPPHPPPAPQISCEQAGEEEEASLLSLKAAPAQLRTFVVAALFW